MIKIVATTLLMLVIAPVYANENYDLECTLDSGEIMTLSHINDTVYIEFLGPNDDPDEGGRVIKLDIPSGGAQQILNNTVGKLQSFVLRGTDEDIEGAIAIVYEKHEGEKNVYFSLMNQMGKETENHACKPDTIKATSTLLTAGLSGVKIPHQNTPTDKSAETSKTETPPIKINIGERLFQYSTIKTPYRTVNITSIAENLTINKVTVNRNQCSASTGNPNKPFNLSFGQTITYDFNIQYRRCDAVEIVVNTNKGEWTFNP